ncbi:MULTISPECIES: nucleotidyltransferase-like protein [Exiguobacterium]|uniref:Nucleotidyltransferase-like protein n=1 Tax=Exiguobacterium alkaliphilum TaxID=1428684 RepID=A0ABT2KZM9_9BACL|nr:MULTISPECIES: nucleotidyltransferase-like protein [Exiguobacterium]MCT4795791.1 nucleotidyltransferase-like protein [Exiguobacterium alkaliphilum]
MEYATRTIYSEYAALKTTLGIIEVKKKRPRDPLTDQSDRLLIVIEAKDDPFWTVKHYQIGQEKIVLHVVSDSMMDRWIVLNENRRAIHWIEDGMVLFERNEFLLELRQRLRNFSNEEQRLQLSLAFAKLLRRFEDGRSLFLQGEYQDAFTQIHHALTHLARLSILEAGIHPEIILWKQVRKLDLEVYKLHEELVSGGEELEQRIHLVIIGMEHLIQSKVLPGTLLLLQVMQRQEEPWSFSELMEHPDLQELRVDLGSIISFLVRKGYVRAVARPTKGVGVEAIAYEIS